MLSRFTLLSGDTKALAPSCAWCLELAKEMLRGSEPEEQAIAVASLLQGALSAAKLGA